MSKNNVLSKQKTSQVYPIKMHLNIIIVYVANCNLNIITIYLNLCVLCRKPQLNEIKRAVYKKVKSFSQVEKEEKKNYQRQITNKIFEGYYRFMA